MPQNQVYDRGVWQASRRPDYVVHIKDGHAALAPCKQAMSTWMMAKVTTSCLDPSMTIPGSQQTRHGRQGHFVYDKLSFDGHQLVSETLAQQLPSALKRSSIPA